MFTKRIFKNLFFITLNTFLLFLLLNIIFVFFSPKLIKVLPHDFVKNISSCYRTFYHDDLSDISNSDQLHLFFGDSYLEGAGEEFLNKDPKFGILNKISKHGKYIVFGRSGYGTISNYQEYILCNNLINSFTLFKYDISQVKSVNFVFYEGNDILDNLSEAKFGSQHSREFLHIVRFFIPFVDYMRFKVKKYIKNFNKKETKIIVNEIKINKNTFVIDEYIQHPSLELNPQDLNKGLEIYRTYLNNIGKLFKNYKVEKRLLYIPSPASVYKFDNLEIYVRSYIDPPSIKVNTNFIEKRHTYTRDKILKISNDLGWLICDTSYDLIQQTNKGFILHGPKDWAHFNKLGYNIAAKSYDNCFDRPIYKKE